MNTTFGIQSDENGFFEIDRLKSGAYTWFISYQGFKTREIPPTFTEGQNVNLDMITLYEGNEILCEITLNGNRVNKFSRMKTAYVAKLPLRDMDNRQVDAPYYSDFMESKMVTHFDDDLKNAFGVENLWTTTGRNISIPMNGHDAVLTKSRGPR